MLTPVIHILTPSIGRINLLNLYATIKPFLDKNLITWTILYHRPFIRHRNIHQLISDENPATKVKYGYTYIQRTFKNGFIYVLDDDDMLDFTNLLTIIKQLQSIIKTSNTIILTSFIRQEQDTFWYIFKNLPGLSHKTLIKKHIFLNYCIRYIDLIADFVFGAALFSIDTIIDFNIIDYFLKKAAYTTDFNFVIFSSCTKVIYLDIPFYKKTYSQYSYFTHRYTKRITIQYHLDALNYAKRYKK